MPSGSRSISSNSPADPGRIGAVAARGLGLALMLLLGWRVAARGVSYHAPGLLLGILDGANFVFHEAGHVLFMLFGQLLHVLGGSLTQVAIPCACTLSFWWRRRYAAAAAALFWTGESVTHVAIYIADAGAMSLPLHGGPGVIHDWNHLLRGTGLINWAPALGQAIGGLGLLLILGALGLLAVDLLRVLAPAGAGAIEPSARSERSASCPPNSTEEAPRD